MSPEDIKSTIKHFPAMPPWPQWYVCVHESFLGQLHCEGTPLTQIHAHASVGVSCQGPSSLRGPRVSCMWRMADEIKGKPNEEWTRSLPFRSALWLHKRQMLALPLDCSPQSYFLNSK